MFLLIETKQQLHCKVQVLDCSKVKSSERTKARSAVMHASHPTVSVGFVLRELHTQMLRAYIERKKRRALKGNAKPNDTKPKSKAKVLCLETRVTVVLGVAARGRTSSFP